MALTINRTPVTPIPAVYNTVSGPIVSISNAKAGKAKSVIADINPVQAGSGDPYPAGGGKNKLNPDGTSGTVNGVTYTKNADGTWTTANTASALSTIKVGTINIVAGNTYILNGCPSGGSTNTYRLDVRSSPSNIYNNWIDNGASGAQATLTATETVSLGVYIRIVNGYNADNLKFSPMIRLSSVSDATYAPYENVRPISGWSEANVTRTGINIWDEEWELGTYNSETGLPVVYNRAIRSKNDNPIRVKPSETYYFKSPVVGRIYYYDANDNYISRSSTISNSTFTTPNNCKYTRFFVSLDYGTTYNHDISVNLPSTDTSYHPYAGEVYPISWQDEAGTVYGVTVDLTRGKLTVDRVMKSFDDTDSWTAYTANRFYLNDAFLDGVSGGMISNLYPYRGNVENSSSVGADKSFYTQISGPYNRLWIKNTDYADLTALQTALHNNPMTVVYKLATPLEYDLTPTAVTMLAGYNNLWADTGDIEVTYRVDPTIPELNLSPLNLGLSEPQIQLGNNLLNTDPIEPEISEIPQNTEDLEEENNGETEME